MLKWQSELKRRNGAGEDSNLESVSSPEGENAEGAPVLQPVHNVFLCGSESQPQIYTLKPITHQGDMQ